MVNEKLYSADEICKKLKISSWTLANWYRWEKKQIKAGVVKSSYLPEPLRLEHVKGRPRRWNESMIAILKDYKKSIITGRNGVYGEYSNPNYCETKKYKNSIKTID